MGDQRISLEQVIKKAIDTNSKNLHTCLPGVVQSFDSGPQVADVQISIRRKIGDSFVNLPLLVAVPVRFFKVFGFSITGPINEGTEVIVFFSERSIDTWLQDGGIQSPDDIRKHSLSDGIAYPMLYSQKNVISNFDNDNLQLRTDAGKGITIDPTGLISLESNESSLIDGITALTDAIKAIQTFGSPGNHRLDPNSKLAISNALTEIKKVLI